MHEGGANVIPMHEGGANVIPMHEGGANVIPMCWPGIIILHAHSPQHAFSFLLQSFFNIGSKWSTPSACERIHN